MQITTDRAELVSAVTFAAAGIGKRIYMPCMAGIWVRVEGDTLTVRATDLDMWPAANVAGTGGQAGEILVPGRSFLDACKAAAKGPVTLTSDGESLTVAGGPVSVTVPRLADPDSQYPAWPVVSADYVAIADGAELGAAITRVARCAGSDDTLPVLTCVLLQATAGEVTLVATDRYRLAAETVAWTGPESPRQFTIPARPLGLMVKPAAGHKITITAPDDTRPDNERGFGGAGGYVTIATAGRELTIRESGGQFPRWQALMPAAMPAGTSLIVGAATLRAAVDRAAKQTGRREAVHLSIAPGTVTVHGMSDGATFTSSETVPADTGDTAEVRYNPAYLSSVLAGFDGDVIVAVPANKPAYVTGDGAYRALLMPVRIAA